ncbi:PLP-dependent aminotransferase family protein [Aquincola tertiaricarbonis]|uniref:PLP-dependent aminotransferase family protein n=1 Tax=Aquincola tertiaricarbonis TaxID=391953 RepID=A0ABY4S5E2_AQUTE|nr:PLP-dependent aminotransferase family protein [Aquincola tertiaricarbonis]URI08542.1 PLP-dependent aminotransferase family protein [Aquincola tertiaricarbonis]
MKPTLLVTLFEGQAGGGRRERLCAALREAVRSGHARLGDRLPSSRDLAQDLGLSRVTVEAAYAQLETEGYLRRQVGQGSFVAIDMGAAVAAAALRSTGVRRPLPEPAALSRRGQRMVDTGGCVEPDRPRAFVAGSPDLQAFPTDLWRHLLQRRWRHDAAALMFYGDPQGLPALREAIARYLTQSRGVRCTAAQVLVLTSSQQALQLLSATLLDEGDAVWMEDPGYAGARTAFAASGAQLVDMALDDHGATLGPARPLPRLIYLTPSHQFPTGRAMSLERRLAFIAQAHAAGAWLIEDDYDSEFLYDHAPTPALQGLDEHGRVVYIGTFSKSLFPSVRLAYMVLPEALVAPLVTARSTYDGHPSQPMQAVAADFLEQGHFAAHLRLMRQLYRGRRDALLQALHSHLPWAEPLDSRGGLQMAVRLPPGSEQRLTRLAAQRGIATPSLGELYHTVPRTEGWRLGFAALAPRAIEDAVQALAGIRVPRRAADG